MKNVNLELELQLISTMLLANALALQCAGSNLREADEIMDVVKGLTAWLKSIEKQIGDMDED